MAPEDVKRISESALSTIVNLAEEAKLAREGVKAPGHAILCIYKSLFAGGVIWRCNEGNFMTDQPRFGGEFFESEGDGETADVVSKLYRPQLEDKAVTSFERHAKTIQQWTKSNI